MSKVLFISENQSDFIKVIGVLWYIELISAIFKASRLISEANILKFGLSKAIDIAKQPEPVPKSIKLKFVSDNSKTFSTISSLSGRGSKTVSSI